MPVTENSDAIQLLQKAKTWLEAHDWCQWYFVRDAKGQICQWPYKRATQCCMVGALLIASGKPKVDLRAGGSAQVAFNKAYTTLALVTRGAPNASLTSWNDSPGRTKAEVLAAYNQAIQHLKKWGRP